MEEEENHEDHSILRVLFEPDTGDIRIRTCEKALSEFLKYAGDYNSGRVAVYRVIQGIGGCLVQVMEELIADAIKHRSEKASDEVLSKLGLEGDGS